MIDFLVSQTLICSLILAALMGFNRRSNLWFGAKNTYLLWLSVPLNLVFAASLIFVPDASLSQISKYMVMPSSPLPEVAPLWPFTIKMSMLGAWALITSCIVAYFVVQHRQYIRSLQLENTHEQFRDIDVWHSLSNSNPQLVGLFSPKIVVPADFTQQFSGDQQRLIMQHEYCHWEQKDPLWNALAVLLTCVNWFNPLFWYAFRQFRQQQELACDSRVLSKESVAVRKEYAMSMVTVSAPADTSSFIQLLYSEKHNMKNRIHQIMRHQVRSTLPSLFIICGLLTISATSHAWLTMKGDTGVQYVSPVKRVAPLYPEQAAIDNVEGWVSLSFTIETDGSVTDVKVLHAEPKWTFETNAITAVEQWRYEKPATRMTDMKVQLDFQLDELSDAPAYKDTEVVKIMK